MNDLNFNVFNVIILAGIIHGVIFSTILLFNKKLKNKTNTYLALTIFSLAFSNLQYWMIDVGLYEIKPKFVFIPFEFLMLPFFFLFVKSYLDLKIKRIENIYLLTPFLLSILYQIVGDLLKVKLKIIEIFNLIIEYISIIFSVIIIVLVFRILTIYEKKNVKYDMSNVTIKTRWLKEILYVGLLLCSIWFVSLNILDSFFKSGYYRFYPLWIGMAILIYWMGYVAIIQKHLFEERKEIRDKKASLTINNTDSTTYSKIDSLILKSKLHLNSKLSLKSLSNDLNLSEGYISQLINKNSNLNFNDYINSLRVNDAKEMLVNNEYDSYTIVAIGLEAGFNSKSSFYTAFKKHTGVTPTEYKKSVRNL